MSKTKVAAVSGKLGDIVACMASLYELWKSDGIEWRLLLNETGDPRVFENNELVMAQLGNKPMQFSRASCEFIKPLIEVQPYIKDVQIVDYFTKELPAIDLNFDRFRAHYMNSEVRQRTGTNLEYLPKDMLGLPLTHTKQWLFNVEPKKIPDKSICIARSCRYQSAHLFVDAIIKANQDRMFFVGTDLEHEVLKECFGVDIMHIKVKDALELAELIIGSHGFFSNGTCAFWVAVGLGHDNIMHELGAQIWTTYWPNKQADQITYCIGGKTIE